MTGEVDVPVDIVISLFCLRIVTCGIEFQKRIGAGAERPLCPFGVGNKRVRRRAATCTAARAPGANTDIAALVVRAAGNQGNIILLALRIRRVNILRQKPAIHNRAVEVFRIPDRRIQQIPR